MFLIIFFLIKSDCILKLYAFDCIYTESDILSDSNVRYKEIESTDNLRKPDVIIMSNAINMFWMYLTQYGGRKYVYFFFFLRT